LTLCQIRATIVDDWLHCEINQTHLIPPILIVNLPPGNTIIFVQLSGCIAPILHRWSYGFTSVGLSALRSLIHQNYN